MRYASILDTVGNTPIVRLRNIAPPHVALYAKIESFNTPDASSVQPVRDPRRFLPSWLQTG